jgi:hypothetical protein
MLRSALAYKDGEKLRQQNFATGAIAEFGSAAREKWVTYFSQTSH